MQIHTLAKTLVASNEGMILDSSGLFIKYVGRKTGDNSYYGFYE